MQNTQPEPWWLMVVVYFGSFFEGLDRCTDAWQSQPRPQLLKQLLWSLQNDSLNNGFLVVFGVRPYAPTNSIYSTSPYCHWLLRESKPCKPLPTLKKWRSRDFSGSLSLSLSLHWTQDVEYLVVVMTCRGSECLQWLGGCGNGGGCSTIVLRGNGEAGRYWCRSVKCWSGSTWKLRDHFNWEFWLAIQHECSRCVSLAQAYPAPHEGM